MSPPSQWESESVPSLFSFYVFFPLASSYSRGKEKECQGH